MSGKATGGSQSPMMYLERKYRTNSLPLDEIETIGTFQVPYALLHTVYLACRFFLPSISLLFQMGSKAFGIFHVALFPLRQDLTAVASYLSIDCGSEWPESVGPKIY